MRQRHVVRVYRDVEPGGVHGSSTPFPPQGLSGTTTPAAGSSTNTGSIVAGILVPVILISIGLLIFYIWYRRKYPVRMVIGKDFSKFSNPKYNKRGSTMTLVRNDAESAWDIPDSPTQRQQTLSPVNEEVKDNEVERNETIEQNNAEVSSVVIRTETNVGAEIAPFPKTIVRERPKKAKLVKTMDFADDLSESAFGIVTESDLEKRTDSDISSGNDSTETHTISLSFRETFDGRHRNTVSAVLNSSGSSRNERVEHRAYSLPLEAIGQTNIINANIEDVRLRQNLSRSTGNIIPQVNKDAITGNEQPFHESLLNSNTVSINKSSCRESIDHSDTIETVEKSQTGLSRNTDVTDKSMQETDIFTEIAMTQNTVSMQNNTLAKIDDSNGDICTETEVKSVRQNAEGGSSHRSNSGPIKPSSEDLDMKSYVMLPLKDATPVDYIPLDKEHTTVDTSKDADDMVQTNSVNETARSVKGSSELNTREAFKETGTASEIDLTDSSGTEKEVFDAPKPMKDYPQILISDTEFTNFNDAMSRTGGILDDNIADSILASKGSSSSESASLSSSPELINEHENFNMDSNLSPVSSPEVIDQHKHSITDGNLSSIYLNAITLNDSMSPVSLINSQSYDDSRIQNPVTEQTDAKLFSAATLTESEKNIEQHCSSSDDRKASLTLSKDKLFLDAPPTPMIIVQDSYIHETEINFPPFLNIDDKDNELPVIPENNPNQLSARSSSFDFGFATGSEQPVASFGEKTENSHGKIAELTEPQENIPVDEHINKTTGKQTSRDATEVSNKMNENSNGQDISRVFSPNEEHFTVLGTIDSFNRGTTAIQESNQGSSGDLVNYRESSGEENDEIPVDIPKTTSESECMYEDSNIRITDSNGESGADNKTTTSFDGLSLTESALIIHEPNQSSSIFETSNYNDTRSSEIKNSATENESASITPFESNVSVLETEMEAKTVDVFEGDGFGAFASSMTVSTDSSGLSWELVSDLSPNSKEIYSLKPELGDTGDVSLEGDKGSSEKVSEQLPQLRILPNFSADDCLNSDDERKISDSSSSREGDLSWDVIDESTDIADTHVLNSPNKDYEDGSSFA